MKRSMTAAQWIGIVAVSLFGSILHFMYEWFDQAVWIAPLSAVNESTWEHLKLLFWPAFIFAMIQSFFFKDYKNFWAVKLRGILFGLFLIPFFFFFYNGVIGPAQHWFNISNFVVSVAAVYLHEMRLFKADKPCRFTKGAFAGLCVLALLFGIFTFITPEIALFLDPKSGTYGI